MGSDPIFMALEQLLAWIPAGHPDEALARQMKDDQVKWGKIIRDKNIVAE